jgi:hypothetical protein
MNNNHVVQISVQVFDKATDPLKRISEQVNSMHGNFSNLGSSLGAFSNTMGQITNHLDRAANSMYKFNMHTAALQRTVTGLSLLGIGTATAVGVDAANKAIDFQYKTYKMQTRMGVSDNVRQNISDYMLNDLSQKTMFKPNDVADLGILLGQAGINNAPDMKSMLKATTFFSESVDANPQQAGEMIVAAAKGFDISMSNASQITNKLTIALNNSLLQVDEMPHAIGELAGRAKAYGQSLDSSLVALMASRDQGMSAAQASQNLLHGLSQLSLIGRDDVLFPKRAAYYQKLGVDTSFFDTKTNQLKEFPDIIASLEKTMANKGLMVNRDQFYQGVAANGGHIPDDVINKMKAMPLMSRVFGQSGQAPILMGLQARYEEVNKQTGEKTGQVLYGSEALKAMRAELQTTDDVVTQVHNKIAETVQFQLGLLGHAWDAAKIKLADQFLPTIKIAANELTNFIKGDNSPGALDRFNNSIKNSADSLRETNPLLATFVTNLGQMVTDSAKVGSTLGPTMKQIGDAANKDLVKSDWGSSIWSLPYHAVTNGLNFIGDVAGGNPAADKAISALPKDLQDQANLTRKLVQGGVALVAAGAIVKIIELAFRAAALTTKGAQLGGSLLEMLFGKGGKGGKGVLAEAMKTMTVTASVVNVYGGRVNGGGNGLPGVPSVGVPGEHAGEVPKNADGTPVSRSETHSTGKNGKGGFGLPGWTKMGKIPGIAGLAFTGYHAATGDLNGLTWDALLSGNPFVTGGTAAVGGTMRTASVWEQAQNDPLHKNWAVMGGAPISNFLTAEDKKMLSMSTQQKLSQFMGTNQSTHGISSMTDKQVTGMSKYLSDIGKDTTSTLTKGFNDVNSSLQNVKVENKLQINISGELKDKINWNISTDNGDNPDSMNALNVLQRQIHFNGMRYAKN